MRNKVAELLGVSSALMMGGQPEFGYGLLPVKRGSTKKNYDNKNSNIEYYIDEKGNIRKRKIKR